MFAAVAVAVVVLDQVSKAVVVATLEGESPVELFGGLLSLRHTVNTGAAFSLFPQASLVFTVIAVVVSVAILRVASRVRSTAWAVSLGLILGGALGNLSDRFFRSPGTGRGGVVDWIDVGSWPVFNVADSAVFVGALIAAFLLLRGVGLDGVRGGSEASEEGAGGAGDGV